MDATFLRRAYDRCADGYDERFAAQQSEKFAALAAHVPAPAPGALVLDAGAGTGLLGPALAQIGPRWATIRIVACDLSVAMLRHARPRATACVQADARRLPFARASFQRIFCVTGIVAAEDLAPALVSFCRVLAPGGWLALSLRSAELARDPAATAAELRLPLDLHAHGRAAGDVWLSLRRR